MTFPVTVLYAAPLAILMVGLSVTVSLKRGQFGVALGDGGHPELNEWIRRHANFAESVPFALLLMALAEAQGAGVALLHALGLILLVSRVIHPFGIDTLRPAAPLRIIGAVGTSAATLIAAASLARNLIG